MTGRQRPPAFTERVFTRHTHDPERWQHVRQLLSTVVALPSHQQKDFLAASCDGDTELLAEVESLVVAHEHAQSEFLNSPWWT